MTFSRICRILGLGIRDNYTQIPITGKKIITKPLVHLVTLEPEVIGG
jgi:hypothetical protein